MGILCILLFLFIYNGLVASDEERKPELPNSRTYLDLSRVESFSSKSAPQFSPELSGGNRGRGRASSLERIASPKKSTSRERVLRRLPSSPLTKIIVEEKKEREKKKKEDEGEEEKKRGLAALNLFAWTGPYVDSYFKDFCAERAKEAYLGLKKKESVFYDLAECLMKQEEEARLTAVENSRHHTPKSAELECLQAMLEKQKILPALGGVSKNYSTDSFNLPESTYDSFDLLKYYRDAISAITRFDKTDWQENRSNEEVRKLFGLIESVLGAITRILIEYIGTEESSLNGYRELLFGSISPELDKEAIGKQEQMPTYYKELYLRAIASVFSGDAGKLEACLSKFNKLVVDWASHILSKSSKVPEEKVVYYKNFIIAAGKQEVDKYKKLLDVLQLGLDGSSNLLSGEGAILKNINNLLMLSNECNKLLDEGPQVEQSQHADIAEKPEEVLLLEHYNKFIFDSAMQMLSKLGDTKEQEGREYYNRLKLDACKKILHDDMKKYQGEHVIDLVSLKWTLENIKRFREKRQKFEKSRSGALSPTARMSLPSVEVNEIGAHILYFEEVEIACDRLLNLFNEFAEKKECERLKESLKAFVKIEAIKRAQKGRKQEDALDAITTQRFLQDIPEKAARAKKVKKEEKR